MCFLGTPLFAKAVLYECQITQKKEGMDWISDQVGIVVSADNSVKVLDAVTLYFFEGPIDATRVRNSAGKLDVRWTISDARDSANNYIPHFEYHAIINKKNGSFALYAKPENYPNRFSGKGHCVTKTAK